MYATSLLLLYDSRTTLGEYMHFQTASNDEKLATIRAHVSANEKTLSFATPVAWVRWLAERYGKLPGAHRIRDITDTPIRRFDSLSAQEKLNLLHHEMNHADGMEHSEPTVPTPWAAWLLAEVDRLTGSDTSSQVRAG